MAQIMYIRVIDGYASPVAYCDKNTDIETQITYDAKLESDRVITDIADKHGILQYLYDAANARIVKHPQTGKQLKAIKQKTISDIDAKTSTISCTEFEYEGAFYGADAQAQANISRLAGMLDVVDYPYELRDTEREKREFIDKAALRKFVKAYFKRIDDIRKAGADEVRKVKAMTTVEEVEAYKDER